jgi:hypothetical protein
MKKRSCSKNVWIENNQWAFEITLGLLCVSCAIKVLAKYWIKMEDESAKAKAARVLTIQF